MEENADNLKNYIQNNWEKIELTVLREGLSNAFYAIVLPEYDDNRFIDPNLPALKYVPLATWKMGIINPALSNFLGLKISEESAPSTIGDEVRRDNLIKVKYINAKGVYSIECAKELSGQKGELLEHYILREIPKKADCLEEELQKIYKVVRDIIKSNE
ncbi:hypothetical protein HYX11_00305 [Candidatus Woesearchaeota archaeon]|nr:hypothetical protein [Candidatus Woesearchaeota archaeon]